MNIPEKSDDGIEELLGNSQPIEDDQERSQFVSFNDLIKPKNSSVLLNDTQRFVKYFKLYGSILLKLYNKFLLHFSLINIL